MALLPRRVGRKNIPPRAFEFEIALIGPAIKTYLWQRLYDSLLISNVKFHIVFCGHVRPDFDLPENFTHLYQKGDITPAGCAERALKYTLENINSRYIMFIADDFCFDGDLINPILKEYHIAISENKGRDVIITPSHRLPVPSMTYETGTPLLGFPVVSSDIYRKIGGFDRSFKGVLWDQDWLFRFYMSGGIMIPLTPEQCPVIKEYSGREQHALGAPHSRTDYLWRRYRIADEKTLLSLWANYPNFFTPEDVNEEDLVYIKKVYTWHLNEYSSQGRESKKTIKFCHIGECNSKNFFFKRQREFLEFIID